MFNNNPTKKTEFIVIFLFFVSIILFLNLSGYTFLGIQSDIQLQSTLSAGEPRNHMMSYPFSIFVSMLYTNVPGVPWYSIIMVLSIILISFMMALYVAKADYGKYVKFLLLALFTALLIFMLFETTITLLTLLLVVFAIPLITSYQSFFWFLLFLASFLRENIIISILPLVILSYMIRIKKISFSKKNILLAFFFIALIVGNHLSVSLDKEYKEWLDFDKSRMYFTDFGGLDKHQILTNDEFQLARSWWICDLDLYPVEKIPQAAGSILDVVQEKVSRPNFFLNLAARIYHNKFLALLLLLTAYIVYLEKNNLRRGYYILFVIGFLTLFMVKDTQRTTFPLLMMWSVLLFFELSEKRKDSLAKGLLTVLLLFVMIQIPWIKVIHYKQNEQMVSEFKDCMNRNSMQLEMPVGFTASWKLSTTALMQNHLFQEKDWIEYHHDLLLSGWFTTHPFFFKQHNISFKNIKRKYDSYYEYLLDSNTGIIGDLKGKTHVNPFLSDNLLRMYDEKFAKGSGCYHKIKIVDQSEHFAIRQIVKVCDKNTSN